MEEKESMRVLARITAAEQWRDSRYADLWQDCYRRYRSQPKRQREGSNLFVPHTFMQCEVIKARLCESLFSQRPYLAALPRESNDAARAQKMQTLLDWQLNERMDLPRLLGERVIANLVIYGTGITYTGWQVKRRRMRQAIAESQPLADAAGRPYLDENGQALELPRQRVIERLVTLYDDPLVADIALSDFFCDPLAEDIEGARFCGHCELMTREALQALAEEGKYSIDWEKLPPAAGAATRGRAQEEADCFAAGEDKELHLVHHYWEDARHLVFLDRCQCICEEENPFWHGMKPYDKCCYVPLPGEFYGMGVPEILAGLQDELNTSRNQRIDYNSLSLRRMWKLRRGCGLTARDLVWRQNGVLQVENMDDVQEIDLQSLPADAFANESSVKQDMQDATGCHDILMGIAYSNETATTTMTRDNNASLRFKAAVRMLVKDLLVPIARKCAAMDQQFLSGSRVVRLLGSEQPEALFSIDPAEINGDYDVIYCGAAVESMANQELNKERALQAYSLALADPAYQNDDLARLKLFRKVLASLGLTEGDDLLPACRWPAAVADSGFAQQPAAGI